MKISIVIPTFNGGMTLERLLQGVRAQQSPFAVELIAIDSGSTDGTVRFLADAGAKILRVERDEFNHGATRNAALREASGTFAVVMAQDAVPASTSWLTALVQPLVKDETVAGSFARQLPSQGASTLAAYALARWVGGRAEPHVSGPLDAAVFDSMTPAERHVACTFDNVCACLRMAVWRQHPFKTARIAEDLEWARDVLIAGHRIVFAPEACVRHSHDRPISYELRRTYLVHQRLQALFALSTIPTVPSLAKAIATTIPEHARVAAQEPERRLRAGVRALGLALAWPLGQYLGARSARTGREYLRVTGI